MSPAKPISAPASPLHPTTLSPPNTHYVVTSLLRSCISTPKRDPLFSTACALFLIRNSVYPLYFVRPAHSLPKTPGGRGSNGLRISHSHVTAMESIRGAISLLSERLAEQHDHFPERQIRRLRVVPRSFVAHERMFRRKHLHAIPRTGSPQPLIHFGAPLRGNVRIVAPENHQQLSANLFRARQRTGIEVRSQFSVVNPRAVETHRRFHIGLQRCAKRQVPADTKSHRAQFSRRRLRVLIQP